MVKSWCVLLGILACGLSVDAMAKGPAGKVGDRISEQDAIASLRNRGPDGLAEALRAYDQLKAQYAELEAASNLFSAQADQSAAAKPRGNESFATVEQQMADTKRRIERLEWAIDQIGGQRSCTVSRLYWYTDLEQAKAAAVRTGRPILSLRMLGKLTDEFSCANSRFFRTALYSNKEISDHLRDNFILHWQSVRPVPRVTIDFGDGRKLERTLTGNSAHYVLAASGEPLDVLPGLYSPQAFRQWLELMRKFHGDYAASEPEQRPIKLAAFHRERRADVYRQWSSDVEQLGGKQYSLVIARLNSAIESARATGNENPLAAAAGRLAESKRAAETPLLRFANFSGPWIENSMDEPLWQAIANLHRQDVKLDQASVALMDREFPRAAVAGQLAAGKSRQENPVLRMVRLFETSMTLDTVRNEYLLHRQIHEQFADGDTKTADVDTLNEWVYAELFLTPSRDPWLGLAPRDVYTALENDGRVEPTADLASHPGG